VALAPALAIVAGVALVGAEVLAAGPAGAALAQSWPPFALVAGLLLVGWVAAEDQVFAAAGSRIAALPGGPAVLFAGLLSLVAAVTVVLNLDTSVVFLTPLLLHAARSRGLDERPFVYGAVLMSNSASLLLPGSNLTNLLVLADSSLPGHEFAVRMLTPWLAAVAVTWLTLWAVYRHCLRGNGTAGSPRVTLRGHTGVVAIVVAALLVLVVRDPALPVLCVGAGVAAWRIAQRREGARSMLRNVNPAMLAGVFGLAVVIGVAARIWGIPGTLMGAASGWQSVAAGTVASVAMNNLPAAVLLSSHPPAHPLFLLLGLDLGPNLAVTGSLSAILWLQVARRNDAVVSAFTYSKLGLLIAPLSIAAASLGLAAVSSSL
jgi:arsenical pump membrane protein